MKIAFFGTPDFAIPSLKSLFYGNKHQVVCIVTQPDKPRGRDGGQIVYSAVKQFGIDNSIPVLQPEKISNSVNLLDSYKPDIIVTCAFGQILRENVLKYCEHGVINVHASLLPKYRGSSPIQWTIINGEKTTGITIMQTDVGLDTGDIILQLPIDIGEQETAGELFDRLSQLGAIALNQALSQIEAGAAKKTPQNNLQASVFPMLSKETARIRWSQTATEINNLIRGLNPWPVAYFSSGSVDVRVFRATPLSFDEALKLPFLSIDSHTQIGSVVHASSANGLFVMCKESVLCLDIIQIPGGRAMKTKDFLNGRTFAVGTLLM